MDSGKGHVQKQIRLPDVVAEPLSLYEKLSRKVKGLSAKRRPIARLYIRARACTSHHAVKSDHALCLESEQYAFILAL